MLEGGGSLCVESTQTGHTMSIRGVFFNEVLPFLVRELVCERETELPSFSQEFL